jgi:hypothetical protein
MNVDKMSARLEMATRVLSIAILIAIAVGWFFSGELDEFMEKAYESGAKTNLSDLVTAQNAFHHEYQKYSNNYRDLGLVVPQCRGCQIFLTKESIPPKYLDALKDNELPYTHDHSFKSLMVVKNKSRDVVNFWTADHEGQIKKLNLEISDNAE